MGHQRASYRANITAEDKALSKNIKKQNFFRTLKFVYFPLFTVLFDTIQFTFMPWQLQFMWPWDLKKVMHEISDFLFFQWFDIDLGITYEVVQFVMAGLVVIFLAVIYAPQQKLLLAIGANALSCIWCIIIMFQSILFMPCAKFLLSGFYCTRYAKSFNWDNPDKDVCWTGRHFAMLTSSMFSLIGLFIGVVHFVKNCFTPLEISKRRFSKLSFALKGPTYAIFLAVIKVIAAAAQVCVKEVLEKEEQARDIVNAAIMVIALGTFILFLSAALPYKNQKTLCMVKSLMTAALFSNLIGLCVAILNNPNDFNLATLWFFGVPSVGLMSLEGWKWSVRRVIKQKFVAANETKVLALGNHIQGASTGSFLELLNLLSSPNEIETVNFSGAFLNAIQVSQISGAMASNMASNYTLVDFSRNQISGLSHGVDVLIAKSTTIRTLILDHNDLPPGVPLLATQLSKNKTLLKLSLSACGLSERAGINLGESLLYNSVLEELNVSQNYLGVEGAIGLSTGLKENKSMKVLDVSWNQMGVEGLTAILSGFDRAVQLNMICNGVPQLELAKLKEQLQHVSQPPAQADGEQPAPEEPTLEQLFEQLGVNSIYELVGKVLNLPPDVAMHALCEDFYIRLVSDARCLPYFANVSMGRMRNLQKTCLIEALGGPKVYKGLDLKTGHAHLKINHDIYDAVIAHLFASVLFFIPAPPGCVVKELIALTEALRGVVCNTELSDIASDGSEIQVTDSRKAAPYFSGTMWSTGVLKKRRELHPGLDIKDSSKMGCCPFMRSAPAEEVAVLPETHETQGPETADKPVGETPPPPVWCIGEEEDATYEDLPVEGTPTALPTGGGVEDNAWRRPVTVSSC